MIAPTTQRATRYLSVFLRWLLVMGVTFALTLMAGRYVVDNVMPKAYAATAQVQAQAAGDVTHNAPASPVAFQAELDFIQSPDLLLAVVKDLSLDKKWADQDFPANSDQVPDVDALTRLSRMLELQRESGTNLIDITVSGDDPNECAAIANAVADHYKTMRVRPGDQRAVASTVRIISRAVPPTEPVRPDRAFDGIVTVVVAAIVSLTAASFVEIIFLFVRAGERTEG